MKLVKKVLAGVAVAAALASSAYASNITVGGVTWDPDFNDGIENDFIGKFSFTQWFTAGNMSTIASGVTGSAYTAGAAFNTVFPSIVGGAGSTGYYLQGVGEFNQVNDPANSPTSFTVAGYEMTYAFGGLGLNKNGSFDSSQAWARIYVNSTTPNYTNAANNTAEVADAQSGLLWLELNFASVNFVGGSVQDGLVSADLVATGGAAFNNFDPSTLNYTAGARFGNPSQAASLVAAIRSVGDGSIAGNSIPEPASLALVGLGLLGLAASRRRKSV